MASLPRPRRLQREEELDVIRHQLGWTTPEAAARIRAGWPPVTGLGAGEFVLFTSYVSCGLGLPISSFFLMLLEEYGLQLQHLTPHSILLVAIFTHLCEMFVGVRPCVALFRYFFVLASTGKGKDSIGAYYFQARSDLPTRYIASLSSARWEEWRTYWVIATTDANERLELPTAGPSTNRSEWRAKPVLLPEFDRVLSRIEALASSGLSSMMVLCDFVRRRIAPLQQRSRPAYLYTGVNDFCPTRRGPGSEPSVAQVEAIVRGITGDPFSPDYLVLPSGAPPLGENQVLRTRVLAEMPTLDESGLAVRQLGGDANRGLTIADAPADRPRHDAPSAAQPGHRGTLPSSSGKGKEVVGGSSSHEDPQRRRLHRGDGSPVGGPAPKRLRTEASPERSGSHPERRQGSAQEAHRHQPASQERRHPSAQQPHRHQPVRQEQQLPPPPPLQERQQLRPAPPPQQQQQRRPASAQQEGHARVPPSASPPPGAAGPRQAPPPGQPHGAPGPRQAPPPGAASRPRETSPLLQGQWKRRGSRASGPSSSPTAPPVPTGGAGPQPSTSFGSGGLSVRRPSAPTPAPAVAASASPASGGHVPGPAAVDAPSASTGGHVPGPTAAEVSPGAAAISVEAAPAPAALEPMGTPVPAATTTEASAAPAGSSSGGVPALTAASMSAGAPTGGDPAASSSGPEPVEEMEVVFGRPQLREQRTVPLPQAAAQLRQAIEVVATSFGREQEDLEAERDRLAEWQRCLEARTRSASEQAAKARAELDDKCQALQKVLDEIHTREVAVEEAEVECQRARAAIRATMRTINLDKLALSHLKVDLQRMQDSLEIRKGEVEEREAAAATEEERLAGIRAELEEQAKALGVQLEQARLHQEQASRDLVKRLESARALEGQLARQKVEAEKDQLRLTQRAGEMSQLADQLEAREKKVADQEALLARIRATFPRSSRSCQPGRSRRAQLWSRSGWARSSWQHPRPPLATSFVFWTSPWSVCRRWEAPSPGALRTRATSWRAWWPRTCCPASELVTRPFRWLRRPGIPQSWRAPHSKRCEPWRRLSPRDIRAARRVLRCQPGHLLYFIFSFSPVKSIKNIVAKEDMQTNLEM